MSVAAPAQSEPEAATRPSRVVCIGSSAGGLEALTALIGSLPGDLPFAYVIAQHLSPSHPSSLAALLSNATHLPVRVALDGDRLERGVILVAAPHGDVTISRTSIAVAEPGPAAGPNPNIDLLLRSAAAAWGELAVAVVLSGTGSDGSAGVRAVRGAGGLTIAQTGESAQFSAMPDAAAATGAVDLLLEAGDIGPALKRLHDSPALRPGSVAGPHQDSQDAGDRSAGHAGTQTPESSPELTANWEDTGAGDDDADDALLVEAIAESLRSSAHVDFTGYKRATLRRQVARRMSLTQTASLSDYAGLVAADSGEARALAAAVLVGVTSFFRDPHAWEALDPPLRELLADPDVPAQVRVWVPGCATGEELYTAAMVVARALGNPADLARRLKIFGTDLSEDALQVARRGQYPKDAADLVPPELRERWMRPALGGWEVSPVLRDCAVFARHHVAWDPPFPRIQLICLRNTMIYFESSLQERVLGLLHFGLAPGGLMMLGQSERVPGNHPLFETLDGSDRIYRRRPSGSLGVVPAPASRPGSGRAASADRALVQVVPAPPGPRSRMRDELIRRFAPPSLVLDVKDDVIEVVGDVSAWCWVADGQHSSNVVALLREELRLPVRSLLLTLRHGGVASAERLVDTVTGPVQVMVSRLGASEQGHAVLSFVPAQEDPGDAQDAGAQDTDAQDGGAPDGAVATGQPRRSRRAAADPERLAQELASTEAALRASVEELSATNGELQALNEELQASSEELQASNEEVQASNEELEATNEELSTLNVELQQRGHAMADVNADLENIQSSLSSGLVLVDHDLRVTRFTPLAVRLFALITSDLGRPLTAIPSTIEIPDLERQLRAATEGQQGLKIELRGDRADMMVQFEPYRRADGTIRGAIVVSTDITELAAAHRAAQRSLRDLVAVTQALSEAVWQRDEDGRILFMNSQVESLFGLSAKRVAADPSLLLAVVHPDDRDRVAAVSAAPEVDRYDLTYRIVRPDGAIRWLHESGVTVPADETGPATVVASALDVTTRHEETREAQEYLATLEAVFSNSVFGVVILDEGNHILRANEFFAGMAGYDLDTLIGMPVTLFVEPVRADPTMPGPQLLPPGRPGDRLELGIAHRRLISRTGKPHFVTVETRTLGTDGGHRRIAILHDMTSLHEANDELVTQTRFDQQTGLLVRAHFRALLDGEIAHAERAGLGLAVLWIDLDGFKEINDRHGHQAGDVVLLEVARRLQKAGRRQDAVGRLGGDEFAMLITDIDRIDNLESVADRVLSELRLPIAIQDSQVYVSGSMGIALFPDDGREPDRLMHNADTAMYAAKKAGRDRRIYFRAEMNQQAEARADLRHLLASAVRAKQFEVAYQPIIDIATGTLHCVEALVRWQRDELVPAAQFIETAAQTGQLRAIGQIALEIVSADLATLDAELGDRRLPVAVNLSPSQLEDREVIDWLLAWDPSGGFERIIIEVTEGATLSSDGRAAETLSLLRRLGARLSIDDFGTGYSNLALLDRLRPSMIKIDRSLLVRAGEQARGRAVLAAAVQLAHALDADVVVEGVENQPLWTLTQTLGVAFAQGYHLARPMPLAELISWAQHRTGPASG